jgi:hypothetical protein
MSRIDCHATSSVDFQPDAGIAEGGAPASCAPSLLPSPDAASGAGGIAEALARLVLESAVAQKASARESEAAEEHAQHTMEDRQVAEMRAKADGMRSGALVEGVIMSTGGAVSLSGFGSGRAALVTQKLGDQVFNGSKIASGLAAADQTDHDATLTKERALAERALRSADEFKRDGQDVTALIDKALSFARDAARTEADSRLASVRWA